MEKKNREVHKLGTKIPLFWFWYLLCPDWALEFQLECFQHWDGRVYSGWVLEFQPECFQHWDGTVYLGWVLEIQLECFQHWDGMVYSDWALEIPLECSQHWDGMVYPGNSGWTLELQLVFGTVYSDWIVGIQLGYFLKKVEKFVKWHKYELYYFKQKYENMEFCL